MYLIFGIPTKPIHYTDQSLADIQCIIKNWVTCLNDGSKFYLRRMPENDELIFELMRYKRGNKKLKMRIACSELGKELVEQISEELKGSSLEYRRFYTKKRKDLNRIEIKFSAEEELFPSSIMNMINRVFNRENESIVKYGIYSDGLHSSANTPEGFEVIPTNESFKLGQFVGRLFGRVF